MRFTDDDSTTAPVRTDASPGALVIGLTLLCFAISWAFGAWMGWR